MTSYHFQFLETEWPILLEAAIKSETMANSDARTSCFYARRTLELAVAWLYKYEPALRLPYQDHLSALIHEPSFRQVVGDALFTKAKLIKDLGKERARNKTIKRHLAPPLEKGVGGILKIKVDQLISCTFLIWPCIALAK